MTDNSRSGAPIDLPGWDTQWIHLGPGPPGRNALQLTFGAGAVVTLQASSAGILRGSTAAGSVALLSSLPAAASPRSQAQPIGGDTALLLGSAASLDLYLPDGADLMVLSVPAPGALSGARRCRLDSTQVSLLADCADSLQQLRAAGEPRRRASAAGRQLREMLRSTSDALFRDDGPRPQPDRPRLLRHLAVTRACEFIDAHLHVPISLADLCTAAGVCTRALEYGFRDFYDLGPVAYVRNLRLCRARDDLLDASRHGNSVSHTARRWCFTHMGQFSHDYRELFGEVPSMTLTRPARERGHGAGVPRG